MDEDEMKLLKKIFEEMMNSSDTNKKIIKYKLVKIVDEKGIKRTKVIFDDNLNLNDYDKLLKIMSKSNSIDFFNDNLIDFEFTKKSNIDDSDFLSIMKEKAQSSSIDKINKDIFDEMNYKDGIYEIIIEIGNIEKDEVELNLIDDDKALEVNIASLNYNKIFHFDHQVELKNIKQIKKNGLFIIKV